MSDHPNPFGFNFLGGTGSSDQPAATINADMIRQAMETLREQEEERWIIEGARARRMHEWLLSIPEHARRHLFVQQYVQGIIGGIIVHPKTAKEIADYIARIIAMTPEEADADSKELLEHLNANYDLNGMPLLRDDE